MVTLILEKQNRQCACRRMAADDRDQLYHGGREPLPIKILNVATKNMIFI